MTKMSRMPRMSSGFDETIAVDCDGNRGGTGGRYECVGVGLAVGFGVGLPYYHCYNNNNLTMLLATE